MRLLEKFKDSDDLDVILIQILYDSGATFQFWSTFDGFELYEGSNGMITKLELQGVTTMLPIKVGIDHVIGVFSLDRTTIGELKKRENIE